MKFLLSIYIYFLYFVYIYIYFYIILHFIYIFEIELFYYKFCTNNYIYIRNKQRSIIGIKNEIQK